MPDLIPAEDGIFDRHPESTGFRLPPVEDPDALSGNDGVRTTMQLVIIVRFCIHNLPSFPVLVLIRELPVRRGNFATPYRFH
jgi:hypothetical protein